MSTAFVSPFETARLPRIIFGADAVERLADEVARFGTRALLVTGARSFVQSQRWASLCAALEDAGIGFARVAVDAEPSPELVDAAVAEHKGGGFDVVVGIGGGSALDAAKAIAGLLRPGNSVIDHLEGVGPERPYTGPATPFVAVPTTAGTGSEATKNAVLSRQGADGFKKSFRDEALVARLALVDPELVRGCPPGVMAANAMDAFTQLLESLVSTRANPMTRALAFSGLEAFVPALVPAMTGEGAMAAAGRAGLAYASLQSGICLAQTGLGSVHGLASPLGAFFPIPHGVVCGTLVGEATAANIAALQARLPESPALDAYARVGRLLAGTDDMPQAAALDHLVATLRRWTDDFSLPSLSSYGVGADDIPRIVANVSGSSMKTNPIVLDDDEIAAVVSRRLAF